MVYVLDVNGKPLMPTKRFGKVRRMLKSKQATVMRRRPFTIQLLYSTPSYVQPVTLGVDAGYQTVGFSAVTEEEEILSGECRLLTGMSERLKERAMYRQNRRTRLRYRKPRFENRVRPEGWLAPSIQHKLDSHVRLVTLLKKLLPVKNVIVEVTSFDIQAIKNPEIAGTLYQQGEQLGFWNL
ncbi:RNA-guided endonuclease IscB [Aneurinibacillus migulanus]|uniref:RNA-guided endonuclease IscB n=1 Tax=Aneurinibacillus migulanus TaxID=47500 RepID=UPI000A95F99C|nr:RNA-guided endonuclease IscB [Aneurinibacillus migulanus]